MRNYKRINSNLAKKAIKTCWKPLSEGTGKESLLMKHPFCQFYHFLIRINEEDIGLHCTDGEGNGVCCPLEDKQGNLVTCAKEYLAWQDIRYKEGIEAEATKNAAKIMLERIEKLIEE
jgi:hypothetical protein